MKQSRPAFTLVEILVVTALTIILLTVGVGIYLSNSRFYKNQSQEIQLTHKTREAADRIMELGRNAVAVKGNYTYNSVDYTTGSTGVIFRLPSINAAGDIIAGSYDFAIASRDPSNVFRLLLIIDADAASARQDKLLELTNNLDSINFTYDNASSTLAKNINFQISARDSFAPAFERVSGGVTLRNK